MFLFAGTETWHAYGWSLIIFLYQASADTPSSVSCRSPSTSHQVGGEKLTSCWSNHVLRSSLLTSMLSLILMLVTTCMCKTSIVQFLFDSTILIVFHPLSCTRDLELNPANVFWSVVHYHSTVESCKATHHSTNADTMLACMCFPQPSTHLESKQLVCTYIFLMMSALHSAYVIGMFFLQKYISSKFSIRISAIYLCLFFYLYLYVVINHLLCLGNHLC
jgi:hypothetical protein